MRQVVVNVDDFFGLLTARLPGSRVVRARRAPSDPHLVLELDEWERVVGIELLGATDMRLQFWQTHPDRTMMPTELLTAVDQWFVQHRSC